jgi:hypothetical protein
VWHSWHTNLLLELEVRRGARERGRGRGGEIERGERGGGGGERE